MKLLAANRLADGIAVWLGPDGAWVEAIDDADIVHDAAGQEHLAAAGKAALAANVIVDPELIDIDLVDGKIRPRRLRERIRAAGPTIHPDLGKQATEKAVLQLT